MASGLVRRANRPSTWLPACNVKKSLANSEPSRPTETCAICPPYMSTRAPISPAAIAVSAAAGSAYADAFGAARPAGRD
jgi:hypothetical protein